MAWRYEAHGNVQCITKSSSSNGKRHYKQKFEYNLYMYYKNRYKLLGHNYIAFYYRLNDLPPLNCRCENNENDLTNDKWANVQYNLTFDNQNDL